MRCSTGSPGPGASWSASLVAFAISETIDNSFGTWLRDRVHDAVRVVATNAISVPIDSVVFLLVAFGSLEFIEGQIVVEFAVTRGLRNPARARTTTVQPAGRPRSPASQ